jgi:hypothetical protein
LPKTAPWRYVDVPLNEPKYDAKHSGPDVGRVVDKISEFRLAWMPTDKKKPNRTPVQFHGFSAIS